MDTRKCRLWGKGLWQKGQASRRRRLAGDEADGEMDYNADDFVWAVNGVKAAELAKFADNKQTYQWPQLRAGARDRCSCCNLCRAQKSEKVGTRRGPQGAGGRGTSGPAVRRWRSAG